MNEKLVVGILAHVDTGKTTLSEALLYETGVINKMGRVDTQDAFLDNDTLERERGITIYSKNARLPIGNKEVILIDTPGHVDFSTEMERALSVLDVAILLISGSSGVQSHTKTLWSLLKSYRIPTFIFVNKMDMDGADKDKVLSEIKNKLSINAVDFSTDKNAEFYENVATCNENVLNEYLEAFEKIDAEKIVSADVIKSMINERELYPVYFGSALRMQGVKEFIEGFDSYAPSKRYDENENEFGGIVYKISHDSSGKRLTFIKLTSGSLKVKSMLGEEKINEIRVYSGKKYESIQEAFCGDICAIAGLNNTKNGDLYGRAKVSVASPILSPAISYAIRYPDDVDRNQMLKLLRELEEEDPSLNVDYKEQTKEIFVSLMGDVQTEVLKHTIDERYKIAVDFTDGKVCYKETISAQTEGVGHFEPLRHYAEVHIKLEPGERGSGMQYDTDVSEDLLDKNWQRLILTHMMEKEHRGVLTGSPITDVKLTVVAGRAHIKHTEGGDFRQATYRAIRQGLMELSVQGQCHLLEPYYDYTLVIPDSFVGKAMTDINNMCGTAGIAENDYDNGITVLTGRAPVSTMNGYVKEVTAYTKGLGTLSLSVAGYDTCHNEEEVLLNTRYNPDSDLRNPSSSVFCSHGAGTVIPWDMVPEYMHVEYSYKEAKTVEDEEILAANRRRYQYQKSSSSDIAISLEEIDAILHSSTHANEKGRQGAYKGISKASVERKREYNELRKSEGSLDANKEPYKYKGAKLKDKYVLVDGYNLIHAWDELDEISETTLDGAAGRLNDILCNYQAITGVNLMVVYDAYKVKGHAVEESVYKNITVVYTKEAQTADQYIEKYAHDNSHKYDITVVTSDGLEQIIVIGAGCTVISSREFQDIFKRTTDEFNLRYMVETE